MEHVDTDSRVSGVRSDGKRRRGLRLFTPLALVAALVVVAGCVKGAPPPPAPTVTSGWAFAGPTGTVGSVGVPSAAFYVGAYSQLVAGPDDVLTVYRPAGVAGAIDVAVTVQMQIFDGAQWVAHGNDATNYGTIDQNQGAVSFGNANLQACCPYPNVRGYWRVIYGVSWGGLGSTWVVPVDPAQYQNYCLFAACYDYGTFVYVDNTF
jgi:hypothetical protein